MAKCNKKKWSSRRVSIKQKMQNLRRQKNVLRHKMDNMLTPTPTDETLREKWSMSIPGVEFLRSNQRVCEFHFEDRFLIKEYKKHDHSDNIIAQVPLAHAHLEKGAVPTIFDHTYGSKRVPNAVTIDHTYALPPCSSHPVIKVETEDVNINTNDEQLLDPSRKDELQSEDLSPKIDTNFVSTQFQCFTSTSSDIHTNVDFKCENEILSEDVEIKHECSTNDDLQSQSIANDNPQEDTNMYKNSECVWTSVVFDSISFKLRSLTDGGYEDNSCIKLPKPWNVNKLPNGSEETLLFTCIVQNEEYGIQKHILEKAVIIKASREITYEVYSTPVDVSCAKLPTFLKEISRLPEILKKFKDLRICQGIMPVDIDYVQDKADFRKDIYSNLRHKDCSILSINSKRCAVCKKSSKTLSQKVKRIRNRKNIQRIFNSVNLLDQMKFKALKKKIKFRAAKTYCLKKRYKSLTDSLQNQQNKVTIITNK
nr:uncharacterized protein LOC117611986 [Osmia lignaria]